MPRSAALQMFEQKFRPFTILCGAAVRAGRQPWTSTGKGEKADRAEGVEGADRRDMKGSQVARRRRRVVMKLCVTK